MLLALALACTGSAAKSVLAAQQPPFPLTNKLTGLEGTWIRDPARGAGGICGVNPADVVTITVSATDIAFDARATHGAALTRGIVTLDGTHRR